MKLEKMHELMILCDLERSILTRGKVMPDETGDFISNKDNFRLRRGFYDLMKKYTYGWDIARESLEEQVKSINEFKKFIIDNEDNK